MGDRGNIIIDNKIWLYTHWSGSELKNILKNALIRGRDRWHDRAYLTRIIFSEMIKENILGTTEFGIDYVQGDGGTEIYIDHDKQIIKINNKKWNFEKFIKQKHNI